MYVYVLFLAMLRTHRGKETLIQSVPSPQILVSVHHSLGIVGQMADMKHVQKQI